MNLKINTGKFKRSTIKVPLSAKPVKGIIKQSVFSILKPYLKNAYILDLFAGSGNLGIEALSNDASFVVFIEQDIKSVETIKENLLKLNLEEKAEVEHKDVLKFLGETSANYDIVFADPPYGHPIRHFLKTVHYALKPKGIFVLFHSKNLKDINPENLKFIKSKCFGKSCYSIFLKSKENTN